MLPGKLLEQSFYLNGDVVEVARLLIGKVLATSFKGRITSGVIVETEAYAGIKDKASHAYRGRFTKRNEVMYREGGIAYVYLCYGIHSLFNVVTNISNIPHAVLVRGIVPVDGIELMLERSRKPAFYPAIGIGPGNASKLLGIHYSHSGLSLLGNNDENSDIKIWIEDRGNLIQGSVIAEKRIGVDYAGEDALLPYRFRLDIKKAP
jgi:DNA-3-methyladenine glycosylase